MRTTPASGRSALVSDLQSRLLAHGDAATRDWWERYLKGAVPFRGVRMADIRAVVHAWHGEHGLAEVLDEPERVEVALELMRQSYAEDKLAGVLFFQELMIERGHLRWRAVLPRWAELFDRGSIADWNTCDWFCVKVLGPLAGRDGEPCARAIGGWRDARNLWQRRASAVAFVNLAQRGEAFFTGFTDLVLTSCGVLVRSPERFSQTGAGWVLRELSVSAPERVVEFLESHLPALSREALKNAIKRLPPTSRTALLKAHQRAAAGQARRR